MIIYRNLGRVLRDEAEGGAGGGGGTAVAEASHGSDFDAVFPSGVTVPNQEKAPAAAPKEKAAAQPDKTTATDTKKAGVFDKFAKKPAEGAAAKPAEGTPTPDPEDAINLGDKAAPETKKHFGELKNITKSLRAEKAALATEIATLKKNSGGVVTPEIERLKTEHKQFSDRLAVLDLQNHPDFQKQFVEPKNKLVTGLNAILTENQVADANVASLIGKPRAEFMKAASEMAAKLPEYERAAFTADARQLHALEGQSKDALTKAGEVGAALVKRTEQQQRTAFEETWKSLDFNHDGLTPLEIPDDATAEDRAALDAYNKGIGEIRTSAEAIAFGRSDEKGVALTAAKAASFDFMRTHAIPRMAAEFERARTLVESLTKEIAAMKGARSAGGGGSGAGAGEGAAEESHAAAAERVRFR